MLYITTNILIKKTRVRFNVSQLNYDCSFVEKYTLNQPLYD